MKKLKEWQHTSDYSADFLENTAWSSDAPENIKAVTSAISEGYPWMVENGYVVVENPDYEAPDGTPNLVCCVEGLIHMLVCADRCGQSLAERLEYALEDAITQNPF